MDETNPTEPACECGAPAEIREHGRDLCRPCAYRWAEEDAAEAKSDAAREDRE